MKKLILTVLFAGMLQAACHNLDDKLEPTGLDFNGAMTYAVGDRAVVYGVNTDRVMVIDPETSEMHLTGLQNADLRAIGQSKDGKTQISLLYDMKTVAIFREGDDEPLALTLDNAANDMYISPDGRYVVLFINESFLSENTTFEGIVSFNMLSILDLSGSGAPKIYTVAVGLKPSWISFNNVPDAETGEPVTTRAAVASISEVILLDLTALPEIRKWDVPLTLNQSQVNNPVGVAMAAYEDEEEIVEKVVVITDDSAGDIIIVKNLDGDQPLINIQSGIGNPQRILLTASGRYAIVTANSKSIAVLDLKEERSMVITFDHLVSNAIPVKDDEDTFILYSDSQFVTFYNIAEDDTEVLNLDLDILEMKYEPGLRYAIAFHTDSYNNFFQATIIDTVERKLSPLLLNPGPSEFYLSSDGLTAYFLTESNKSKLEIMYIPDNTRLSLQLPATPVSSTIFNDGRLLFIYDYPTGAFSLFEQGTLTSQFDVMINNVLQ